MISWADEIMQLNLISVASYLAKLPVEVAKCSIRSSRKYFINLQPSLTHSHSYKVAVKWKLWC